MINFQFLLIGFVLFGLAMWYYCSNMLSCLRSLDCSAKWKEHPNGCQCSGHQQRLPNWDPFCQCFDLPPAWLDRPRHRCLRPPLTQGLRVKVRRSEHQVLLCHAANLPERGLKLAEWRHIQKYLLWDCFRVCGVVFPSCFIRYYSFHW